MYLCFIRLTKTLKVTLAKLLNQVKTTESGNVNKFKKIYKINKSFSENLDS